MVSGRQGEGPARPLLDGALGSRYAAAPVPHPDLQLQGPVVVGAKVEDRLRIRRGLKAVVSAGMMRANTRAGKVLLVNTVMCWQQSTTFQASQLCMSCKCAQVATCLVQP